MKTTKSKKEIILPEFFYSLNFSNNALYSYIIESYRSIAVEGNNFSIKIEENDEEIENLIKFTLKEENFFILIVDKDYLLKNYESNFFFISIEQILKESLPKNFTITFLNTEEIQNKFNLDPLIFFLQTKLKLKTMKITNRELPNFLHNFYESLINKEEKSKITFFDSKPQKHTNLSLLAGINDENSLTFIDHLICIPGISETKAIAIAKKYPFITDLMKIYDDPQLTNEQKSTILKEIEIVNSTNNTTKKLGNALSDKIFKVFSQENSTIVIN